MTDKEVTLTTLNQRMMLCKDGEVVELLDNEIELASVLVQIKQKRLNGYYVMLPRDKRHYDITVGGRIPNPPEALKIYDKYLSIIMGF